MEKHLLTLLSSHGGCAAKISPDELQRILDGLKIENLKVSTSIQRKEDVGIFRIRKGLYIVQSVDMITPVSDNPTTFGAIAAAHALSDIYAKGAKPLTALLILGLPAFSVSTSVATEILQGAIDKLQEAGTAILGGHTVATQELLFGLSVTGSLGEEIVTNTDCKEGDALVLTKPLGSGIIITALKLTNAQVPIEHFSMELVHLSEEVMLELNAAATRAMLKVGVHACTDVTGFGLFGHLYEMLTFSGYAAHINMKHVPIISGVTDLATQDVISAGCERNAAFWWNSCEFYDNIPYAQKMILFDPQTSGGLLISLASDKADALIQELHQAGIRECAVIGHITQKEKATVVVSNQ
jgi:selenide, water dikinase